MPESTPDLLRRAPLWIVAAMLALVPIATGNLTGLGIGAGPLLYDTVALPRLVIAFVLTLAAWAAWFAVAARREEPLRIDMVWALLGALAVWAGISAALSPHRALAVLGQSERLEGVVTVVLYVLLYGLALQVVRRVADARVLITALAGAVTLLAVYGLAQYAGLDPTSYVFERFDLEDRRAFATFGNPNFLAGLLVLALPLPGALALGAKTRAVRIVWTLASVVVLAALIITFTRGAWLAAAIQIVLGVVVWRRLGTGVETRAMRVMVGLAAAVVVALLAMSLTASGDLNVIDRMTGALSGTGSAHERSLLVPIAWDAALERPLTGYGPDTFLPAFRMHRSDDYVIAFGAIRTMNNAHSWPLQYAATLGLPGALLLVVSIGLALWRARRVAFARPATAERERGAGDVLMAAAWVGCVGFVIHMLFNVAVPGSVLPFWVLLGVAGAPLARSIETLPSVSWAGAGLAVILTTAALVVSATLLRADARYLESRSAYRGVAPGDPAALAERARELNPTSVKYARGLAEVRAGEVTTAVLGGLPAEEVRQHYFQALADFEWLFEQSPDDYPGFAWLAALQARVGVYLEDPAILGQSQATAQRAVRLDRQAEEVLALSLGGTGQASIERAAGVPPLP